MDLAWCSSAMASGPRAETFEDDHRTLTATARRSIVMRETPEIATSNSVGIAKIKAPTSKLGIGPL